MTYSMTHLSYRSMRAIGQRSSLPSFHRAYYRVSAHSRSRAITLSVSTAICKLAIRSLRLSHSLPASYTMDQHPWAHGGSLWNPLTLPHVPSCIPMHLVTLFSHCHSLPSLAPNPVHHDSPFAYHAPHDSFLSLSSHCHLV